MLITHDLGVVAEVCRARDRDVRGQDRGAGAVAKLFDNPQHPYTMGL